MTAAYRSSSYLLYRSCWKGQCHEIFCFWFFSWISFLQAPENTNRAVSNFFENSKNNGINIRLLRWTWRQKCIYVLTLLSKGVPPKLIKFFWLNFFICHRCQRHRWSTLSCEYLRKFSKKIEMVLMGYSGAGGELIDEKNQKQKISWHCPFKEVRGWGREVAGWRST